MKQRHLVPERMDDPGLCPLEHQRALAGLRRINRLSGTAAQLQTQILRIAARDPKRVWRILDVGCANGEVAFELSRRLAPRLRHQLTGWDMSPTAIAEATSRLRQEKASTASRSTAVASTRNNTELSLSFEVRNLFDELEVTSTEPPFDLVYCTLLLHHFSDQDAVRILAAMKRLARHAVLVDDLQRTRWGWLLAVAGCHLLSRSPVVHFDGPQSVRAAFTCEEALGLASAAGWQGAKLRKHWPERYLLSWEAAR
ncbi:MAG: methyltransferase domain-containing protein [Planctomycetota bacterium]